MVTEGDIHLADSRILHAYDTRSDGTGQAIEQGNEGYLEDTLASVQPWGFRPEGIRVPVLVMHGAKDKMVPCAHGTWLAARSPAAELRTVPDAGHITVLDTAPEAVSWLAARVLA